MISQPVQFQWDGDAMVPANSHWARQCDERFTVGERYSLDEVHARSTASHAHYFAALHQAWLSLPDAMAAQFPTAEHLRKYALIKAGFCDKRSVHASSVTEARKMAAFTRPLDSFAIVTTEANVITIWTAQSQDHRSMDKATFQRSKEEVLGVVADLLGVEPETLARQVQAA